MREAGSIAAGGDWRLRTSALEKARKPEKHLELLSGHTHLRPSTIKHLNDFYQRQNAQLDSFKQLERLQNGAGGAEGFAADSRAELEASLRRARFAMNLSLGANICLCFLKLFMAAKSGSLSIIVSALDSLLDVASGFILWLTDWLASRPDKYRFPIGRERFSALGILVFSSTMGTVGVFVFLEGLRQLLDPSAALHSAPLSYLLVSMGTVLLIKFLLYLLCRSSQHEAVKAFAQDHFNDLLTNSVGLVGAVMGDRIAPWADPAAAMILASYVVYTWGSRAYENIQAMAGTSADPAYLQRLTFLCWNHDQRIQAIDTVRAYTFGARLFVEVDIILPPDMPLREAHDVGESLQNTLELLPEVERAFVHLDFEATHAPEHMGGGAGWQAQPGGAAESEGAAAAGAKGAAGGAARPEEVQLQAGLRAATPLSVGPLDVEAGQLQRPRPGETERIPLITRLLGV